MKEFKIGRNKKEDLCKCLMLVNKFNEDYMYLMKLMIIFNKSFGVPECLQITISYPD